MIDLHCHLLPGIDDGAGSLVESLELVRIAVDDGITHLVVTPHLHPGRYENTPEIIEQTRQQFADALQREGIVLPVRAAAEARLSAELMPLLAQGRVPFLGRWQQYDVLLLELPHSHIPPGCDNFVRWLKARNILPMIAHPERNKAIAADIGKLAPFVEQGCLFQLTAMSVCGKFGAAAHRVAVEMLQKGWVSVIATDAHNTTHRPPILSEGLNAAAEIIGETEARRLVWDTPALLLGLA